MTSALAYMRVSGKGQEVGDGFERQRIAIERYAALNDIAIASWYQDVQTGKDEWQDRPGWSAMMAALNGTRTILVEKLDRVARAVLVQELILADLMKREVRLLTSAGDDTDDQAPERQLFRVMLAGFAQYERQSICLKLRGARQRKKDETGRCEGRKPFGFRPGEQDAIDHMKWCRDAGCTYSEVASAMNTSPHKTRSGSRWLAGTVQKILQRL